MIAVHTPPEERNHTPEALRRIAAYRIRFSVTVGPTLLLRRFQDGRPDALAIAVEATMRRNEGLPEFIHELDASPENRNPAPWAYCMDTGCSACMTAVSAHLTPRGPQPLDGVFSGLLHALEQPLRPWVYRATNALAAWLDRLTTKLAERKARR